MHDFTELKISSDTVFSGRVFKIEVDRVRLPDGSSGVREVVRHPGGVGVLAVDDLGRAVLIRQFRYAAGRETLEIPAGRLERGESPADCGRRELEEETGFACRAFEPLGYVMATPGYCDERIWLFLATGLVKGPPRPDEGEFVESVFIPLERLEEMILSGEISDGKTIAAVFRYRRGNL